MQLKPRLIASVVSVPLVLGGASLRADQPTGVPNANPKITGVTSPTALSPELAQIARAATSRRPRRSPTRTRTWSCTD